MKLKIEKINILIFLSMCINAFLAIPFMAFSIKRKKESVILFGIFFAILGFFFEYTRGTTDLERYYTMIEAGKKSYEIFFPLNKDFYAKYLSLFLIENNLPKNFLGMSSAFLTYYYLFKTLKIMLIKYNIKYRILCYILLFIIIPINGYTGIRFYPAVSIFTYGYILQSDLNKKKGYIYMILSIFIHISILLPLILYIISKIIAFIKNKSLLNYILIISLIIGIIGIEKLMRIFIYFLPEKFQIYILPYISSEGFWGKEYGKQYNYIGRLVHVYFFPICKNIVSIIYGFLEIKNKKEKNIFLCLMISFYFCVMFDFLSFSSRYSILIVYIFYFKNLKIIDQLFNRYINLKKILILHITCYSLLFQMLTIKVGYIDYYISYIQQIYKISLITILMKITL